MMTLFSCKSKPFFQLDFDDKENKEIIELQSLDNVNMVSANRANNSNEIKVSYVGYDKGSIAVNKHFRLNKGFEEATLNYSVKFSKDFQFKRGGKLLGLGPKMIISSGKESTPDGWSVRAMFKPKGRTGSYIYHQNRKGKWGDTKISDSIVFTKGKYSNVSLYVKVNKPASEKNGIMELWVDGKLVVYQDGIQYRAEDGEHTLINKFLFVTRHGGQRLSYAPRDSKGNFVTNHAYFNNIEIHEGKHITRAKKKN